MTDLHSASTLPFDGPDTTEMERMARRAVADMPAAFRQHLGAVVIKVEEFADRETLTQMNIPHPMQLSGLYTGLPIGKKSSFDSGGMPDTIHLYRQPILGEARQRGIAIETLVRHVLVHEVGHHFGFSDDDMHAIEDGA